MLTRRGFLQTLLGGAAGAAILPYVPKSYFFLGKAAGVRTGISLASVNEIAMAHYAPGVIDNFFKSGPLMAYLKEPRGLTFEGKPIHLAQYAPITAGNYRPGQSISLATVEDVGRYATP